MRYAGAAEKRALVQLKASLPTRRHLRADPAGGREHAEVCVAKRHPVGIHHVVRLAGAGHAGEHVLHTPQEGAAVIMMGARQAILCQALLSSLHTWPPQPSDMARSADFIYHGAGVWLQ